jgi:hypothetical protein
MAKVFISYRRSDSRRITDRIYNWLAGEISAENIFRDVNSNFFGADFRHTLEEALKQCDVILAVIGRNWLKASDESGRRLAGVSDYVRMEIESGLERNILVIPVLVDGAEMPAESSLPSGLGALAYCHAIEVRDGRYFGEDMRRLLKALEDGVDGDIFQPRDAVRREDEGLFARIVGRVFPRLHLTLIKMGLMTAPPEMAAVHAYLKFFAGKMNDLNRVKVLRYIRLGGTEGPGTTHPESEYGARQTRTEVLTAIRRTVRLLSGVSHGGDEASAQLASFNQPSRVVRNVASLLRRKSEPIILLGDPGSGKSMTLRQVGLQIAQFGLQRSRPPVVIYVRLGQYREARGDKPLGIWSLVKQHIPSIPPEAGRVRDWLPLLEQEGRLVILFDGMDEMERRLYGARVSKLSEFATSHRHSIKTLFACRLNDFNPKFIHRQLVLLEFDRWQVRDYLRRNLKPWPLLIDGKFFKPEQLARNLLNNSEWSETARNPLTLYLLCIFFEKMHTWPHTRRELFDNYLRELFYRGQEGREHTEAEAAWPAAFDGWARLAFRVTIRHASTSIELDELREEWGAEAADAVVENGIKCGLLVRDEFNEQSVRYTHHRLQEYLTAHCLDRYGAEHGGVDWGSLVDTPRWQEILINLASIQQERSEALRIVLESMQTVTNPAVPVDGEGEDLDAVSRTASHRRWQIAEERLLADRVLLASRIIRELGQNPDKLPPQFLDTFKASVQRLAEEGRPTTQVKMLWAWGNTANVCPLSALDRPLESGVEWVREQALSVVGAQSLARTQVDVDLRRELVIDLTNGRLLRRLRSYGKAIARANDPGLYVHLAWAVVCRMSYVAGLLGLFMCAAFVSLSLWPIGSDIERVLPGITRTIQTLIFMGLCFSFAALTQRAMDVGFWRRTMYAVGLVCAALYLLNRYRTEGEFFVSLIATVVMLCIVLGLLALGMRLVFWTSFILYTLPSLLRDTSQRWQTAYRIARKKAILEGDPGVFRNFVGAATLYALAWLLMLVSAPFYAYIFRPAETFAENLISDVFNYSPWPLRTLYLFGLLLLLYLLRLLPRWMQRRIKDWWQRVGPSATGSVDATARLILGRVWNVFRKAAMALPKLTLKALWFVLKAAGLIIGIFAGVMLTIVPLIMALDWLGLGEVKHSRVTQLLVLLVLTGLLSVGLLALLRPYWLILRSVLTNPFRRRRLFAMSVEEWVGRIKTAEPEEQFWYLNETSPQMLGIKAEQFMRVMEGLEEYILYEPAASKYWKIRSTLEEIARQERLANIAGLDNEPSAYEPRPPEEDKDEPSTELPGASNSKAEAPPSQRVSRRAWLRLVFSVLLLSMMAGALLNAYIKSHRTIYVVNGLPTAVEVDIDGGETFRLEPGGFRQSSVAEGSHTVTFRRGQPETARAQQFQLASTWFARFLDENIYIVNLEGAAILRWTPAFSRFGDGFVPIRPTYHFASEFQVFPRPEHLFKAVPVSPGDSIISRSELRLSPDLPSWVLWRLPPAFSEQQKLDLAEKYLREDPGNTLLLRAYEYHAFRYQQVQRYRDFLWSQIERPRGRLEPYVPFEWYSRWQEATLRLEGIDAMQRAQEKLKTRSDKAAPLGEAESLLLMSRLQTSLAEVLKYHEQALRADPRNIRAWYEKCLGLEAQAEFRQAREACLESRRLYLESIEERFNTSQFARVDLAPWAQHDFRRREGLFSDTAFKLLDLDLALRDYEAAATRIEKLRDEWEYKDAAHAYALALDILAGERDRARKRQEDYDITDKTDRATSAITLHYLLQEFEEQLRAAKDIPDADYSATAQAFAQLELGNYAEAEQSYRAPYPEARGFFLLLVALGVEAEQGSPERLWQQSERELRATGLPVYTFIAGLLASHAAPPLAQIADLNLPPIEKAILLTSLAQRFPETRLEALSLARKLIQTPDPPGNFLQRIIQATARK